MLYVKQRIESFSFMELYDYLLIVIIITNDNN